MTIVIPADLDFADLDLQRSPVTHNLLFAPAALAEVCRCNGLDPVAVLGDEDLSCSLIAQWYLAHVLAGGAPDDVAEQILAKLADAVQPGDGPEH